MSQDPQHKTECEIVPFLQTQLMQQVYCNRRVSSPGAFYSGSQIKVSDLVHIVVLSGDVNKQECFCCYCLTILSSASGLTQRD